MKDELPIIRNEAYSKIVLSSTSKYLFEHYPKNLAEMNDVFESKDLGVWCSGAAYYLYLVYEELGYQSWVYTYGLGDFSHTTTLVKVGDEIFLQDAYLNYCYELPILEVLKKLKYRDPVDEICIDAKRTVIFDNAYQKNFSWMYHRASEKCVPENNKPLRIENVTNLQRFTEHMSTKDPDTIASLKLLQEAGYPTDLRYHLLFPRAIYSNHNYVDDPLKSEILALLFSFSHFDL